MNPHFYFVSFLKWNWKCVLTDFNKGANIKKWLHSSPCEKQWGGGMEKLCLATKGNAALIAAKYSGSQTELLILFSHIWWTMLQAQYSPFLSIRPVTQSLQSICMRQCSWPQWSSPICGLDFDSGISSDWLTAWVCFCKWLYHNYKCKWVNLLTGGSGCLSVGNIYSI